jgi:hypothetical protein
VVVVTADLQAPLDPVAPMPYAACWPNGQLVLAVLCMCRKLRGGGLSWPQAASEPPSDDVRTLAAGGRPLSLALSAELTIYHCICTALYLHVY